VMLVVPQSLLRPPVTARYWPGRLFNGINAAFMPFQPRESGIHAVWSEAGGASVTEVRFGCTRRPRDLPTGYAAERHLSPDSLEIARFRTLGYGEPRVSVAGRAGLSSLS
jgi:hypothetical protein